MAQLKAKFALFDQDGDGSLTKDEIIGVLTRKTDSSSVRAHAASHPVLPAHSLMDALLLVYVACRK